MTKLNFWTFMWNSIMMKPLFLERKKLWSIFLFLQVSDGEYFDQEKPWNILSESIQPVLEMSITVASARTWQLCCVLPQQGLAQAAAGAALCYHGSYIMCTVRLEKRRCWYLLQQSFLFLMTVKRIRLCMGSTWLAVSTWGLGSLYVMLVPPACSNGALLS